MSNVLLLVHRIPFPPDKGDKIRSYHLLRFLAKDHRVFLGTFYDNPDDREYLGAVREYCADVFLRPAGGWRSKLRMLWSLLRGQSLSVGFYRDKKMQRWVDLQIQKSDISVAVAFSSAMAQFIPAANTHNVPEIADFVDVDSDKWRQYSEESRWPLSRLYIYEATSLAKWEARIVARAKAVTVVSDAECRLLARIGDGTGADLAVVSNGVDDQFFDPYLDYANPYPQGKRILIFTGAMDYYANEDGVAWFASEAWPQLRAGDPELEFYIVGSKPTRAVRALGELDGVTVTGYVPDVRPYLRYATVAIAPLRLARGVQNKVLEALAMNLQVVAGPQALQGLAAPLPSTVTTAALDAGFAETVREVLTSGDRPDDGESRRYIGAQYDWATNLSKLTHFIDQHAGKSGHDSASGSGADSRTAD